LENGCIVFVTWDAGMNMKRFGFVLTLLLAVGLHFPGPHVRAGEDSFRTSKGLAQGALGTELAFASNRNTGRFQIWIVNPITSGSAHEITFAGAGNQESNEPNWSNTGRIVYQFGAPSVRGLHLIKPDGTDDVQLLHTGGDDRDPSWSPDGRFIVFASQPRGATDYDIWIYDTNGTPDDTSDDHEYCLADSTGSCLLMGAGTEEFRPQFSPDGRQIAFVTTAAGVMSKGKNQKIAVVPIQIVQGKVQTTGAYKILTDDAFTNIGPTWSPDSLQIAYSTTRNGNYDIYRMSASLGEKKQTQLTTSSANDINPAWSFNGNTIAFATDRDGNREIYRMSATLGEADAANLIRITNDPSDNDDVPAWNANVNVSRLNDEQYETAVAINPHNPKNIVIVSNHGGYDSGNGLFEAVSMDQGLTWTSGIIANGDSLQYACCDPSLAFDSFGNLFLTFLAHMNANGTHDVQLGLSTDGGQTWTLLSTIDTGIVDQPKVTTGPSTTGGEGSVWVSFSMPSSGIEATGALVTGKGKQNIGTFTPIKLIPNSAKTDFSDIAIGPNGSVMVTYEDLAKRSPATIYVSLKPDGLGTGEFNTSVKVTSTNVRNGYSIPAQPGSPGRGIDATPGLAWDRSEDSHKGRVYLVYTDAPAGGSVNTDIYLRYSDDSGSTWSNRVKVNDDKGTNSQFFPHMAVDQTTGYIAVSWYDCRNDLGDHHIGDTDGIPNDDTEFFAAISTNGGIKFQKNLQVSAGPSNSSLNPLNFGDYSGLDYYGGNFFSAWADNSNSTGDNPDGALSYLDVYTQKIPK
jgi:Tol biopolymer transport system component